jgi:hypothetical protein
MMGFDIFGMILMFVALSLMTVDPLHLTIARTKEKVSWFSRAARDDDDAPHATDREKAIEAADAELAEDPMIRATTAIADIFNHV